MFYILMSIMDNLCLLALSVVSLQHSIHFESSSLVSSGFSLFQGSPQRITVFHFNLFSVSSTLIRFILNNENKRDQRL